MDKAHGIFLTGDVLRWHSDPHKGHTNQAPFSYLSAIRGSWLGWCLRSAISNVQSETDRVAHRKLWRGRDGGVGSPMGHLNHKSSARLGLAPLVSLRQSRSCTDTSLKNSSQGSCFTIASIKKKKNRCCLQKCLE